jgi:formate--tetrahydrofolate ligase
LKNPNVDALANGVCNLEAHLKAISNFGVPCIVAINHFADDSEEEVAFLTKWCHEKGYEVSFLDGFLKGGEGAIDLAKKMQKLLKEKESHYQPLYQLKAPLKEKIEKIAKNIYGASGVVYTEKAEKQLEEYAKLGFEDAYICMAKTPQSLTDDPLVLGAPKDFKITVREANLSAGANFVVCLTGEVMTMPGLPKVPAAVKMEDMPW